MESFWATVIAASITGVCGIIVGTITSIVQANATRKILEYRLQRLEDEFAEIKDMLKTVVYGLEKKVAILEEIIATLKERISALERDVEALNKKGDDGK